MQTGSQKETYHRASVEIAAVWGDLEVGRNERWGAVLEVVVVFGQVFAEQRVDLRWPTLADQEFGIVIVAMLLTTKETRWNHRAVSSDTGT